jgi:hypothetical protein
VNVREAGYTNVWNDDYPSGGNYWSNNAALDTNQDALADASYVIDADNRDQHPLMARIDVFDAGTWSEVAYMVAVVSNSTVTDFHFKPAEGAFIRFDAAGEDGTRGFCRVTIPKSLLWAEDGWTILVGGQPITGYSLIPDVNGTYIYFTYNHSTKTIEIRGTHVIPEFLSLTIPPLFLILTLFGVILKRRRLGKQKIPSKAIFVIFLVLRRLLELTSPASWRPLGLSWCGILRW